MRLAAKLPARALALGIALASARAAYPAQAGVLGVPEFDPPTFKPGQAVTVYALMDPAGTAWSEETLSTGLPEAASGDAPGLLSVSLRSRSGMPLLVVRFVPWRPGSGAVPPLTVGGLSTPPLRFSCASALADGNDAPPEYAGQLEPAGFRLKLYLSGGAALAACVAAVFAAAKLVPAIRELARRKAFAAARSEFDAALAALASSRGGAEDWAVLCSCLRRFVGARAGTDWSALTSGEAAALPKDSLPGEVQPEASAVLAMGDRARFSGAGEDFGRALALAAEIGARLDEAIAASMEPAR